MNRQISEFATRRDGNIVLDALKVLQRASLDAIVAYIAEYYQVHPESIREKVVDLLDKGVKYAFIQKYRENYFINGSVHSRLLENAYLIKLKRLRRTRWGNRK